MITIKVPGKIHLMGEHTAVYGKPAILAAIDKYCTVENIPSTEKDIQITSTNFNRSITLTAQEIILKTNKAQKQWEMYRKENKIDLLQAIIKDELDYPIIAVGETLKYLKQIPQKGFHLRINSDIPIGSGLGSSAAVAVGVVACVAGLLVKDLGKDSIGNIAIRAEQKKHGNPSYGDVAAVINGGLIWFCKTSPDKIIVDPLDISFPEIFSKNLFLIQTGIPIESTGEMVHLAAEYKKNNAEVFEQVLKGQEQLAYDMLDAIKKADEETLLRVITKGEQNLERIDVVSKQTQNIISKIERTGGAAKICGAGGRKKGSGIALAYHSNRNEIKNLLQSQSLDYFQVKLGVEGLRIK